jgi:hypothetical protein
MIACFTHDHGHAAQARLHGGTPAPLARDQLKTVTPGPDNQRLNDTLIANRPGQLSDFGFIEGAARLEWARRNTIDGDFMRRRFGARIVFRFGGARYQRA